MPAAASHTARTPDTGAERAGLESLAAELTVRGYRARLRTPHGQPPYLDVINPHAAVLSERVYAHAGAFWWSWAEKITDCHQVTVAAGILARVLRTADGQEQ